MLRVAARWFDTLACLCLGCGLGAFVTGRREVAAVALALGVVLFLTWLKWGRKRDAERSDS